MLTKIISGGQTGADRAGLEVAKLFGLQTGGWIPKGYRTINGSDLSLKDLGLIETDSDSYPKRTFLNVNSSDGTIRLAVTFNTPGEVCTYNAIKKYNKPYIDVDLTSPRPVNDVIKWILDNDIEILNVAGNTDMKKGYPVGYMVSQYLSEVLSILKDLDKLITEDNKEL